MLTVVYNNYTQASPARNKSLFKKFIFLFRCNFLSLQMMKKIQVNGLPDVLPPHRKGCTFLNLVHPILLLKCFQYSQ